MTASALPSDARTIPPIVHRDLARAISAIENGYAAPEQVRAQLDRALVSAPPRARDGYVIGITGPPGAGKSTVTDRLIEHVRARGETVAVVAVDPSSPFTHGAVLGDRVRMQRHSGDDGVFIRSMASREDTGGLAPTTREVIAIVERAGFDVVILETVGVGQVELEIVAVADVIAVVTVPALGDGVQSIKAGLTEIADVFLVNMADRPGANQTAAELLHMVRDSHRAVPVLKTIATTGEGIAEATEALLAGRETRGSNAERAVRFDVIRTARDAAVRAANAVLDAPEGAAIIGRLVARELSRTQARDALLALLPRALETTHAD